MEVKEPFDKRNAIILEIITVEILIALATVFFTIRYPLMGTVYLFVGLGAMVLFGFLCVLSIVLLSRD